MYLDPRKKASLLSETRHRQSVASQVDAVIACESACTNDYLQTSQHVPCANDGGKHVASYHATQKNIGSIWRNSMSQYPPVFDISLSRCSCGIEKQSVHEFCGTFEWQGNVSLLKIFDHNSTSWHTVKISLQQAEGVRE